MTLSHQPFEVLDTSPKISLHPQVCDIPSSSTRRIASCPFADFSATEIVTPCVSSLLAPTDLPASYSEGLMDDCQPLGWVEQRMLDVGRKLGLFTNGHESLLLCYLSSVRDFESTTVKSRRKDRTARELTRLSSYINYSNRKQNRTDAPRRARGDKSNPG